MVIGKLEKIIIVNVVILFIILSIISILRFESKFLIILGLFFGNLLGIINFLLLKYFLVVMLSKGNTKKVVIVAIMKFVLYLVAIGILVILALKIGKFTLYGFAAGLVSIYLVICIISIISIRFLSKYNS